jgi:hypothetical protein
MRTSFEDLIVKIGKVKVDHNFEIRHKSYSFLNLFWKVIIRHPVHPVQPGCFFLCVVVTTCAGVSSFVELNRTRYYHK